MSFFNKHPRFGNGVRLVFLLSGEHPILPQAEVCAAVRAERCSYEILERFDQVMVLETNADPRVLGPRLGMCREISLHLCTAEVGEVLEAVGSTDLLDLVPHGKTLAVRVRRIKRYSAGVDRFGLSRDIADLVLSQVDFKVDLEDPETVVSVVLTDGMCVVGLRLFEVGGKELEARKPKFRKAFHPSTLQPKLARCMINLARAPRGGTLLDPFCGVGGILIEAGLMGIKPVGVDIDPAMVEKARTNLESYGIKNFKLSVGDARRLSKGKFDAVVTDPPYGRQASTGRADLESLYEEVLPSIASVLRRGGRVCITSPAEIDIKDFAEGAGFIEAERYEQRVHRTLTRRIYVLRR